MRLKRLIVHGFKSFKDRTTIQFDDGITGIVGPNGCGKSNIVDALFWVMGEQSAKHLRGNSMKDLIFAGSSKYTPAAWAEVSLVLENDTGKHIHIGNTVASPSEIQLTRKLYKNGETEYRINGHPCRLKDIQEVFMDTGAGAKSYSIIAQGEISRLVQSKPEERRVMIEEVAGITKFKIRKRESLKKIDQTEANLSRLSDLQVEIEKNLHSLQKQAEKAEKARTLKEKIKKNDLVVNSHKVYDLLKNYKDSKNALNGINIDLENWRVEKETVELSLEEERFKQVEEREKVEELQIQFNETSKELAGSEQRLNFLNKNIEEKDELIITRSKEIEEIKLDIENRTERLNELESEQARLESFANEDHDYSELRSKVDDLKEDLELREGAAEDLKDELEELKSERDEVEKQIFKNTSKLEEFATSLEDLTAEIEALEKQYSGVSSEIADERESANASERDAKKLKEEEQTLKAELDEKVTASKSLQADLNEKTKQLIKIDSTLASLKEIAASLDSNKEGIAEFMNSNESGEFEIFGNLVQCEDDYVKASQSLLFNYMNSLINSGEELDQFYTWIQNNPSKGMDFSVPHADAKSSDESFERLQMRFDSIKRLADVVTLPQKFSNQKALLDGLYIVDDFSNDIIKSLDSGLSFSAIASKDGQKIIKNSGKSFDLSIASEDISGGVVERNNRITSLSAELEQSTKEVEELETLSESRQLELEQAQTKYENVRMMASEKNAEAQVKKTAIEAKLQGYEANTSRLEILKNRKSEISKQRIDLLEQEDSLAKKRDNFLNSIEDKSASFDDMKSVLSDLRSSYSEQRDELLAKELEAKSFVERLESLNSQIEDAKGQLARYSEKLNSNNEIIEKYTNEIENMTVESEELETKNSNMATALSDKEEVLSIMKDRLAELLLDMQERESDVKSLSKKINESEKAIDRFELSITQSIQDEEIVTRDIFEKYQIDLRLVLGNFLEYTKDEFESLNDLSSMYYMETETGIKELEKNEYEFVRKYGQDLRDSGQKLRNYKSEYSRLGDINWQAIEDYERQKLRFDFLREQEIELRQSLTDLQEAIAHIDEKSKERFKIAFEEVDSRFKKVFPIIFGGGEARLSITGDFSEPDCGVDIIAKPPGKKMQNINLMSGGEKAMTAVSLIFSIFLVKPSPFCLLDEVDAPLDDANVGRFNELLREMSKDSQFILITHNKKTMEMNDVLYGVTMQEPGVSKAVSVQLH